MKVYIKKYIKSEGLPTPNYRKLLVEHGGRNNVSTYRKGNPQSEKYWNEKVDYYLEEREIPDEMEIHKIAQNYNAKHNGGGQSFQDGANFILNKLS